MTDDDKLQAFAAWLASRGIESTASDRTIAVGFLALAGRRPVCADDIAQGSELARSAALTNDEQFARVGAQLLEFEAARAAPIATAATAAPVARAAPIAASAPVAAIPPSAAAAKAATSAPTALTAAIAAATAAPVAPSAGAATPALTVRAVSTTAGASDAPARGARSWGRALALAGVGVVAIGAVAVGAARSTGEPAAARDSAAPSPAAAAPRPADGGQRLRRVPLQARLPAGWREAGDAELGAFASQPDSTLVLPGGATAQLDRGLFVAMAPAGEDLVEAARSAERGAIRHLGIAERAYRPDGCALVDLGGAPAARCRGIVKRGAGTGSATVAVAVAIYVRAVGARNVVAMLLTGSARADAADDADAIVASLRP